MFDEKTRDKMAETIAKLEKHLKELDEDPGIMERWWKRLEEEPELVETIQDGLNRIKRVKEKMGI